MIKLTYEVDHVTETIMIRCESSGGSSYLLREQEVSETTLMNSTLRENGLVWDIRPDHVDIHPDLTGVTYVAEYEKIVVHVGPSLLVFVLPNGGAYCFNTSGHLWKLIRSNGLKYRRRY